MSTMSDFVNSGASNQAQVDANTNALKGLDGCNFIINGDCIISQIGSNQQTGVIHGIHAYDCWRVGLGAIANINTDRISGDYPITKLTSSFKATYPAAHTLTASSFSYFEQSLDGIDTKNLIDTDFTFSFWVKSSVAGSYSVAFQKFDGSYSYVAPFTINAANTWEYKTITILGGLPSTLNFEKAGFGSLRIRFCPVIGSSYQTATTSQWISGNYLGVTGHANAAATANNTFHFTGVKLEIGTVATDFISEYEFTLSRCMRRFQRHYMFGLSKVAGGNTVLVYNDAYPVGLRSTPSITYAADGQANKLNVEGLGYVTIASGGLSADRVRFGINAIVVGAATGNWFYTTVEFSSQII